jgi:uncharacterized Tic20 family protein
MVNCPRCNSENQVDVAFCVSCGEKLPLTLVKFLHENTFQAYGQALQSNHIDTVVELAALGDNDLAELGIPAGDRIRLRKALAHIRAEQPLSTTAPNSQGVGFAAVGSQAVQLFNTLGQAVGEALPVKDGQEKNWAIGLRLSGLAGFLFPGANIIAPLALWMWKKKESPLLDATGKEVLNFQLSCFAYGIVAAVADSIFKTDNVVVALVALFWLVLTSVGAYQAFQGRDYRYPFIFRPVK